MGRTRRLTAEPGEFSETVFAEPKERLWDGDSKVHLQHRMYCCDCGLAHDFEFVIVEARRRKNAPTMAVRIAPKKFAIQYRVKRNERATAQVRRKPHAKK